MPTRYEALLFVHVLAVVVWVGGAIMHLALMALARRSGEREHMLWLLRYDDRLGPLLYVPAALVVLGAGVGLTLEGPWSFGEGWIVAGLVLLGVAFVGGAAFFIPAGARLRRLVAAEGETAEVTQRHMHLIERVALLDLLVLVAAIYVMTVKPGL